VTLDDDDKAPFKGILQGRSARNGAPAEAEWYSAIRVRKIAVPGRWDFELAQFIDGAMEGRGAGRLQPLA
jgi:hypothetical protein